MLTISRFYLVYFFDEFEGVVVVVTSGSSSAAAAVYSVTKFV